MHCYHLVCYHLLVHLGVAPRHLIELCTATIVLGIHFFFLPLFSFLFLFIFFVTTRWCFRCSRRPWTWVRKRFHRWRYFSHPEDERKELGIKSVASKKPQQVYSAAMSRPHGIAKLLFAERAGPLSLQKWLAYQFPASEKGVNASKGFALVVLCCFLGCRFLLKEV